MADSTGSRSRGLLIAALGMVVVVLALSSPWLALAQRLQTGPIEGLDPSTAHQDYVTGVLWAVLLTGFVAIWGTLVRFRTPLLLVWAAKVVVALGLMLPYDYIYGVDPDGYYINASAPGFQWTGFEIGQGTLNTQQLVWMHVRWLSASYNASRLSFALLGLAAVYLIYRAATNFWQRENPTLFYLLAFTPSILFWSSILGKDPISLFSVACYLYGASLWRGIHQLKGLLWIAAGIMIAIHLRSWLGPILLVPLAVLVALQARAFILRVTLLAIAVAGLFAAPQMLEQITGAELGRSDKLIQTASDISQSFVPGGSSLAPPEIRRYRDLATFAPFGMFTILFRPLPGEVRNLFGTLAGMENLCLLLLAIRALFRLRPGHLVDPLAAWMLSILLLWAAVYSVVSYQNLGTASRYKLEVMPLLIATLLYIGRRRSPEASSADQFSGSLALRPHWNS